MCLSHKIRAEGLFPFVILEKVFSFLLLILLNDFWILFIFCRNVNVDESLLFDKNKNPGVSFFRVSLF